VTALRSCCFFVGLAAGVVLSACYPPIGSSRTPPRVAGGPGQPASVIVVSVAGLGPAPYAPSGTRAPLMPTLAELARTGASATSVVTVAPASRYPAHATLVTGERPAGHGIVADQLIGDRGVRSTRYWHASHLRATTVWQLAKDAGLRVAALSWPTTVGAEIDQLIPDLAPTARGETWLSVIASGSTPALLEQARQAGAGADAANQEGATRDAVLVTLACEVVAQPEPPNLLLLHLSQTAPALARYGPDAPQTRTAFRGVDADIDRLLRCVARAGRLPETALVVVGDRGTMPVHTEVFPNAALAAAGLQVPDAATGGIRSWSALVRSNGGSAFVYARSETDALLARRALTEAAQETRAFRIVSAGDMLERAADPEAWFGIEAEPGYTIGNGSAPPLVRASARRGVGGYLTPSKASDAGFVAWGRGVRSEVRIQLMRQTDVGPTVARLLGLELDARDGRPVVGILALPASPTAAADRP